MTGACPPRPVFTGPGAVTGAGAGVGFEHANIAAIAATEVEIRFFMFSR
jgi:hypothetical protein